MQTTPRLSRALSASLLTLLTASSCRWGYDLSQLEDNTPASSRGGENTGGVSPGSGGDAPGTGGLGGSGDGGSGDGSGGAASGGQGGAMGSGGTIGWWNATYAARSRILLNNNDLTEALTDFPVAVFLNTATIDTSEAGPNGESLRFIDSNDTTRLWHEVEHWDSSGTSVVWVQVPHIPAGGTEAFIRMYYGNDEAVQGARQERVWTNGYIGVWHLNENTRDSSANQLHGTSQGATLTAGVAAGGYDIAGTGNAIALQSPDALDNVFLGGATISTWLRPRSYGASEWPRILDKSIEDQTLGGWSLQLDDTGNGLDETVRFEHDFTGGRGTWVLPDNSIPALPSSDWLHLTLVYDSTSEENNPIMYLNGAPIIPNEIDAPAGDPTDDSDKPLSIGNIPVAGARSFDGAFDEMRISSGLRSSSWILAEYQTALGLFTTIETPEAAP